MRLTAFFRINIVLNENNELSRLDLEMTRLVRSPNLRFGLYARTIGKLLETYTYAVQPETIRTTNFAQKLMERINPPCIVLKH